MAKDQIARLSKGLVTHYSKCYELKYGLKPIINVYRDRWGFVDMLDEPSSIPYDVCKRVIEYYFRTTTSGHPLKNLFHNFDHLLRSMQEREEDDLKRAQLRKETEKRVREWEAKNVQR